MSVESDWAEANEAKWHARDIARAAALQRMADEAQADRAKHVATVYDALVTHMGQATIDALTFAEIAVDALMASGVVFARMGAPMTEGAEQALSPATGPGQSR